MATNVTNYDKVRYELAFYTDSMNEFKDLKNILDSDEGKEIVAMIDKDDDVNAAVLLILDLANERGLYHYFI